MLSIATDVLKHRGMSNGCKGLSLRENKSCPVQDGRASLIIVVLNVVWELQTSMFVLASTAKNDSPKRVT